MSEYLSFNEWQEKAHPYLAAAICLSAAALLFFCNSREYPNSKPSNLENSVVQANLFENSQIKETTTKPAYSP